ncbi:DNA polymerase III subunit alpha [Halobacillus litoralis]|uniref:DNA polymerase III subunit alpha n=1 Tax=Halobacillus litoralis TaxID=45668 RepID=UPI001CFD6E5C|nr:DNA polymerase III subunit alpha [Halobacillus litoralis]
MTFTHLQVRSGYSLMNSTIKVNQLVEGAKHSGFESLALTDEDTMSSAVSFYQACISHGIHPIIGLKTTVEDRSLSFPVLLYAKDSQGYQNLLKISTWKKTKVEPLNLEQLKELSHGLIVVLLTSESPWADPIAQGMFSKVEGDWKRWTDVFSKEDFYLSIQDLDLHSERQLHKPLKEWSESVGAHVVAVGDVRYLNKEDAPAYQCLRAIAEGTRYRAEASQSTYYLKTTVEMEEFFNDWWPEVLTASEGIAQRCQVELELDNQLLPSYPTPGGVKAGTYLRELCENSLVEKYKDNLEHAKKRLEHELNVIQSMEFSDYFLIVWDFIDYARGRGIYAGPGRGSAAGSIVAYLLNITQVDPIEYNLLFERFLNPERVSMPDIDIDFPDQRRDEVIEYVAEKYGRKHVAQICTFGTFAAKSVLRELFKVLGIDDRDASFILHQIPKNSSASLVDHVKQSEELKDYIRNSESLKFLFKVAAKLEGLPRHVSTHAAGVVLSEKPLVHYTPLMDGQGEVFLTQLAMGDLEKIGLLKIDFLGLRNLTFMEKMEKRIKRYRNSEFSLHSIPLKDEQTFALLSEGRTNGVFQLESQGMKSVLTRLKPSHFEDVVAVNALYRPGPMDYIKTYIDRKHERAEVSYPHPDLKPILQPTFGVLVYQEQIMQVAQLVAGYTLGEADLLRRAVSKKQSTALEKEREKFLDGSKRKGYKPGVSQQLFDWIVKFSNYGFNRSHAVAYSMISYQLAYMKAHYPSYFLAELMNVHLGDRDKLTMYIREAREMDVIVKSPSINNSHIFTRGDGGGILMGLVMIKGVGYQAAQEIIRGRENGPFQNLNDFCLRVGGKAVSRSVIESLIIAGAFDQLHPNRASALANIDQALEQGELFKEFQDQPGFFGSEVVMDMIEVDPFPPLKRLSMEKEVLGTYMSEHPLEHHRLDLRKKGIVAVKQAYSIQLKKKIEVAAVIDNIREIRTKRGDAMAFVSISDETGEIEAVLFPESYRQVRTWISEQMLVLAEGKIDQRNDRKQLIMDSVRPFEVDAEESEADQRLFIKVSERTEYAAIDQLKEVAEYFPGNTPVYIFRSEDRKTYRLDVDYSIEPTRGCLNLLNQFFGREAVALRAQRKKTEN